MKRRMGVKLLALGMAIAVLGTGCQQAAKEPVALELWHYYNGSQKQAFDQLVTEFNETVGLEQGIVLEAFSQGGVNELSKKLMESAGKKVGAQEVPDIFAAYADSALEMDQLGLVAELDGYLTPEELAEYQPTYLNEGRITGDALKIFPIAKSTEIMMVNQTDWDLFAKAAGKDLSSFATIESVIETAQAYYEWTDAKTPAVQDGKALFGRDAFANYMLVGYRQITGKDMVIPQDGKAQIHLDKAAVRRLWDSYYIPYINGWFVNQGRFRSDDIKTGDLIALVGSTSSSAYFPELVTVSDSVSYPIQALVLPAPGFAGAEPFMVQQGAGMVVSKSDPATEAAAVTFLKWFTQAERNLTFSCGSGYMPVKQGAGTPALFAAAFAKLEPTAANGLVEQVLVCASEQWSQASPYFGGAYGNSEDVRMVLERSMPDIAKADRGVLLEKREDLETYQTMLLKFSSDAYFDKWYQTFSAELTAAAGT